MGKSKVNVLMIYPTREYRLFKTDVKMHDVIIHEGALYKIDPRAVFVNKDGEKLVILYRMHPVAVTTEYQSCPKEIGECAINPAKLGEYINQTFNPDIQWLIQERAVNEIYLKPAKTMIIVLTILMFVLGLIIGLVV